MPKQLFCKEYEEYLLTGNEESIKSLPNGSYEKEYFFLIKKLLNEDLTPELDKSINFFISKLPSNQTSRLKALQIFKKLKKYPEKKDEIISDIKNLFSFGNVKEYQKPLKYNKNIENTKEEKLSNELDLDKFILCDKFVEEIYKGKIIPNDDEFKKVFGDNKYITLDLNFNKRPKNTLVKIFTSLDEFSYIIDDIKSSLKNANIKYFQEIIEASITVPRSDKYLFSKFFKKNKSKLLTEQIECLLRFKDRLHIDELMKYLIESKYPNRIEDKNERLKILKELKKYLIDFNYEHYYMTNQVIFSILKVYSEMNIFDLNTFIEYIEFPCSKNIDIFNISKKYGYEMNNNGNNYLYLPIIAGIYGNEEQDLIEKYLKHFFIKKKMDYTKFSKYFNENYIKKFFNKMKFYSGNEEVLKENILSSIEIGDLMKEVQLNICDFNKEIFNINEDIELTLEIKNIQTLYVHIYEINTENYYYSNKTEFDEFISLDGLVPTFEEIYNYNDNPQLLLEKQIKLEKIPKKRGLYIIEFIGNNHVSRAVIKKGNIKCIHKNTINGKVFYLLDENNQILKGEKTGIWLNNIWYPCIKDTGAILIPYSIKGKIFILKHDDFCTLEKRISIPDESYEFTGQFIINEESFIMGNTTKILVRPYLFVCGELCPLEYLKNVKLIINVIKTENNQEIPSKIILDNVKLSYDEEFCFDFQVPAKLKGVQFALGGGIKYKTSDKKEILYFSANYKFTRIKDYGTLIKKDDIDNYLIYFVGKAGEPKINHQINLKLCHNSQGKITKKILLETDSEGKINLGKLININSYSINDNDESFYLKEESDSKYAYMPNITLLENQELNIPFYKSINTKLSLIKYTNNKDDDFNGYDENLTGLLKYEITDKVHNLGKIILPKLLKGKYKLNIDDLTSIDINVVKGKLMDDNDFIVLENGNIKYNNDVEPSIAIENVFYKNNELKIKLNKNSKSLNHPRIHINCVQYLPRKKDKNL